MAALPPLPQPGLPLYPGFLAQTPQTFFLKQQNTWSSASRWSISFADPSGTGEGQPFLTIQEDKRHHLSFKTLQGQEVMRIIRQRHRLSGKGTEYHGMRGDGREVWYLKLHRGCFSTDYNLKIFQQPGRELELGVQNKVVGADKGILYNGTPVATMSQHEKYSHLRREDIVQVAPGMDILLSLGVAWIRADKQAEDEKVAVAAAA